MTPSKLPTWVQTIIVFALTGVIGYSATRIINSGAFEQSQAVTNAAHTEANTKYAAEIADLRARLTALEAAIRDCKEVK